MSDEGRGSKMFVKFKIEQTRDKPHSPQDVANSTPLCNELLQVAHAVFESDDANSQVALLNAWCHLIDCFRYCSQHWVGGTGAEPHGGLGAIVLDSVMPTFY